MKAVEIDELGTVNVTEEALIPIVDPLNGVGRVHLKEVRGLGVKSQETFFLVSNTNTGVTIATSGWVTTPRPTTATSRYLWSYTKYTYNDNRVVNTAPAVIGVYGDKGDKGDKGDQGVQGIQGVKGDKGDKGDQGIQGVKGDTGKPFTIAKTYTSIAEMNNSFATDGIEEGSFVIIDTGDADDVDTGKLYIKDSTEYRYVTDMSSAGGVGNAVSFTYVVDSDEALKAWANNVAGNDYTSVLIRKGTWTSDVGVPIQFQGQEVDAAGVNLTTTGTKVVVGEPESKLVFSNAIVGLGYNSVPTTQDYWMRDVQIDCTTSTGGSGFCQCGNLSNCICIGTNTTYGFIFCNNLINCVGTGTWTDRGVGIGFRQCDNLLQCTGAGTLSGFYYCNNLISCIASSASYGFTGCRGVSHCKEGDTPCTTALFYQSYASLVEDERFLCNGTADGGFNGNDVSSFGVAGDLQSLTTTEKSSLVGAINELNDNTTQISKSYTLPTLTAGGIRYIKIANCRYHVSPTIQCLLRGYYFEDKIVINVCGGHGLHINTCGWYTTHKRYTRKVIIRPGSSWDSNFEIWVEVQQQTTLSVTLYAEKQYESILNTDSTLNVSTTSPTGSLVQHDLTGSYNGFFGNGTMPPIDYVYTQYSGQTAPASLYAGTTWSNITASVTAPTGATVWKRTN